MLINKKRRNAVIATVFGGLVVIFICLLATKRMTVPFFYRVKAGTYWSIGTIRTDNPLNINFDSITVIDYRIQQTNPEARFMADPFIVENDGVYYIFYEYFPFKINSTWADIAVLKSTDLKNWEFLGVVLDESFHLSYPFVFKCENKWYMIPETHSAKEISLYETSDFPYNWKYRTALVKNRNVVDAALFVKDNVFYLLALDLEKQALCLFFSNNVDNGWREHCQSPLRNFDIRPGGRPLCLNNRIIYFVQDHTNGYGKGLLAYEIDSVSPTYFSDRKIDMPPVLWSFGDGWAANGMHHLSCVQLPDSSYFCVADGCQYHEKYYGWDWLNFPKFDFRK